MHQFTQEDTQTYDAREVADLLHNSYVYGKEKAKKEAADEIEAAIAKAEAEARFTKYRWLAAGLLIGAGCVLLYQVIA